MSKFLDRPPKTPPTPSSSQPGKKPRQLAASSPAKEDMNNCVSNMSDIHSTRDYEYDELREVCTLGTGSFGTVKLVHHESSGDAMALKILKKETLVEFRQEKNILSEKNLLLECTSCPFIINLISTFNLPNRLCMLLELVQGGELLTHLYDRTDTIPKSSYGGFEIECVRFYIANILLAYDFMHSRKIAYRDLKPENILINIDGYIKLADFGFAKVIPYESSNNEIITRTHTIVGSPEYMAPEMINGVGYDQSVDYWSLGCLIFELVFADSLFADKEGLPLLTQANVVKSTKETILQAFKGQFRSDHPALLQLALSLLVPDPVQRTGFKNLSDIINSEVFGAKFWGEIEERKFKPVFIPSIQHHLDTSNFYDFDEGDEIVHDLDFDGDQSAFELF